MGTTLSRSWTINDGLKAVVADSYELSRSGSSNGWQTDKTLSLANSNTGTTVSVGAHAADDTAGLLPSVSAQQKVVGNFQVTTTLADNGSDLNKSVTAGFTHRW